MSEANTATQLAYRSRIAEISETDIAWFSGWLCADGSIKAHDKEGRPAIRFCVTDKDPLDRIAALFGNNVYGPFAQGINALGSKPIYEWKLVGWKCVIILRRCLPWLSVRYAERAEALLAYPYQGHGGKKITPDDVLAIRRELESGEWGVGRRLAREYGVSEGLISAIKHGHTWNGVTA